ncbi:hypothetical protein [Haliangium sp.]|uniref:HORMA-1 domain-containing protein n=1 Tax=Haliangium sp. TaxID=2663208 RepID=UPI003D10592B
MPSYSTPPVGLDTGHRYIVDKIMTDLRRLRRCYGKPKQEWLPLYERELAVLLPGGFVAEVEYGFQRRGRRVLSLAYTIARDGTLREAYADTVPSDVDVHGAGWHSYLRWSRSWLDLPEPERGRIEAALPFRRESGTPLRDGDGCWRLDRTYAHHHAGAERRVFGPLDRPAH